MICLLYFTDQGILKTYIGFFVDFFFAWHAGITFCSALGELDTENLRHIINSMNVTHLHSTPSLVSSLGPDKVPTLRYLLTSGEPQRVKMRGDWAGKGLLSGMLISVPTSIREGMDR